MKKYQILLTLLSILLYLLFSYLSYESFRESKEVRLIDSNFTVIDIKKRVSINSKDIYGGEQSDLSFGVNWYLNPATRLMINYDYVNVKNTGKANVIQARMQIDF